MRKTSVAVGCVVVILGGSAATVGGCISDSPEGGAPDASFTFDGNIPDGGFAGFDTSAFSDVFLPDGSLPDGAPIDASLPPVDAPPDAPLTDGASPDAADAADAADAGGGTVTSAGSTTLTSFRQGHSATLLTNGHVLICGGYYGSNNSLASCDNFDPGTNTVAPAAPMNVGRQGHMAVRLANGQVLIAGGAGPTDAGGFDSLASAEIYDATANTFTVVTNPMQQARGNAGAVLVSTGANAGKVVLVGGGGNRAYDSGTPNDFSLASAEVFDPGADATKGTFAPLAAQLSVRRGGSMTAAALPEGGLLAAGGSSGPGGGPYTIYDTAETLDPAFTSFSAANNAMSSKRQGALSVVLLDGRVFIFSGYGASGYSGTADIFDPVTRSFTSVTLPAPRGYPAVALLKSGRVLIAGGVGTTGTLGDLIVYDPIKNAFLPVAGALTPPRSLATATTLDDGRVVIAGGQSSGGPITPAIDIFHE